MCRTGVLSFMSERNDCSERDERARDPYEIEKSSFGMKIQLYENTVESLNFQEYLLKTKQFITERVETHSNDVHIETFRFEDQNDYEYQISFKFLRLF